MQEKPLNQNSDNEVELGNFTGRVSNFFDSFLSGFLILYSFYIETNGLLCR